MFVTYEYNRGLGWKKIFWVFGLWGYDLWAHGHAERGPEPYARGRLECGPVEAADHGPVGGERPGCDGGWGGEV